MTFPVRLAALPRLGGRPPVGRARRRPSDRPRLRALPRRPRRRPGRGGRLLLGELNCVSCHQPRTAKKQAPILDDVGTPGPRQSPAEVPRRPAGGQARHDHAGPVRGRPGAGRQGRSAGPLPRVAPARPSKRGRTEGASSAAATRTRRSAASPATAPATWPASRRRRTFGFAVPLGDLKAKYSIPGLAAFLANPLQTRPAGRMPHLLKANEAADVANYLLQGIKVDLPGGKGTTKYAYYEGGWDKLPDFAKLKPKATGQRHRVRRRRREGETTTTRCGSRASSRSRPPGRTRSPSPATTAAGSRSTASTVVDNDGIHAPQTTKSGTVELTKGVHKVVVDFFQGGGEASPGRGDRGPRTRPPAARAARRRDRGRPRQEGRAEPPVKDEDALDDRPGAGREGEGAVRLGRAVRAVTS